MNGKRLVIAVVIFLAVVNNALATVDSLRVNHITKEYNWIEHGQGDCGGVIGWQVLGEVSDDKEQQLIEIGYTLTVNPFFLDQIFLTVISVIFIWFAAVKIRHRRS